MTTLDPYSVLQVSYDADLPTIRIQFKKLVMKAHPDKGGNPKVFQIIKNAYSYLYKYKTNEAKQLANEQRTHEEAKKSRERQTKQLKREFKQVQNNPYLKKIKANSRKFDSKTFNTLFNEFKTTDADDRGYDIIASSKQRMDASDLQKKYGNEQQKQMQIVVITEPEPMELGNGNWKQLGLKHVDDFSKTHNGKGQGFTDLQQAYTNRQNMDTMGNSRGVSQLSSDGQISSFKTQRGRISYEINPEEQMRYDMKKQQQQAMEEKRRHRFDRQTKMSNRQFQRMQNYIDFR